MIIRQLRIFRCRALNICVTFRSLWATSRDGSPKGPFPSIRFLVLRGYFWASALRIDFCTRGVRYRCVVRRAPNGYERRNRRGGCTCGNLASRRLRTPERTLIENPYSYQNSYQKRSDGKNRKITATEFLIFYRRPTYRRTRRFSLLGPGSKRGVYLPVVTSRKRNIAATFAKPVTDRLRRRPERIGRVLEPTDLNR